MSQVVASEEFLGPPSTATLTVGDDAPLGIPYWVRAPQGYAEQWETDANQVSATLIVNWEDSADFLEAVQGFTRAVPGNTSYFQRQLPLLCPLTNNLYALSMRSSQMGTDGGATWLPDPDKDNWPLADSIAYATIFGNRPYEVLPDSAVNTLPIPELARYVQRRRRFVPRERGISGSGYEVVVPGDKTQSISDERQFTPFYEFEFLYTWFQVPMESIPWSAITRCVGRVNRVAFDDGGLGVPPGGFPVGTCLFKGTAGDLIPYRQPNETWSVDIPYLFAYQPGSGVYDADYKKNGWNTLPNASGGWYQIRTSAVIDGAHQPLYFTPLDSSGGTYTQDFSGLFRPSP